MLITIEAYINGKFAPGSEPHHSTVRKWLEAGKIKGEKVGGRWYIETSEPTSNPLANKILSQYPNAAA